MNNIFFKLTIITLSFLSFSCNIGRQDKASKLYSDNYVLLNKMATEIPLRELFNIMLIDKKSFIEKLFTLNFKDEKIVSIIDNMNSYVISEKIYSDTFTEISNNFLQNKKKSYNTNDLELLTNILKFMDDNDIETVNYSNKSINIPVGIGHGLQWGINSKLPQNIHESHLIENNWYYVSYK